MSETVVRVSLTLREVELVLAAVDMMRETLAGGDREEALRQLYGKLVDQTHDGWKDQRV